MLLAALLESQPSRAHKLKKPIDIVLARGLRRAAAPGGPLPGEKLMALLRHDRWTDLEDLGRDDPAFHRLHRGFRAKGSPISDTLQRLDRLATELLGSPVQSQPPEQAREFMSYDFEGSPGTSVPVAMLDDAARSNPKDLEAIVLVLELAAIRLTDGPDSTFSVAELLAAAREIGGEQLKIEESDIKIVLGKAGFLKKAGNRLQMR